MAATDKHSLRARREAIMLAHIEAENRHDIDATIATFHSPRYEVNGEPSDGEQAVRDLLHELMDGLPDVHAEVQTLHHADEAVIGEARITGTHAGSFGGVPATGRRIEFPMVGIFEFEEDRLVCEKVYYDVATVLRQIGVLEDPANPPD